MAGESTFQPDSASAAPAAARPRRWTPGEIAKLFETLPPHAIEAEMCLLGSILIDPGVLGDVSHIVRSGKDFHKSVNGQLFDLMVELYNDRGTIDIVQLHQLLVDRDLLAVIGGQEYLLELASTVPAATSAPYYARLVRDKATVREIIEAAGDVLHAAYTQPGNALELLDQAQARMFAVAQDSAHDRVRPMKELIEAVMHEIEQKEDHGITGVPTGFVDVDEITHGLQKGEMIILAARPSMGKTAMALNIAENMALRKIPVAVFSMEMSREQLIYRVLASRATVKLEKLRNGMLSADDDRALAVACGELVDAPLYIDDTPGLTVTQLRVKARRMVDRFNIRAVVVDYLQLMTAGGRVESRQIEVSAISRGIKAMARELDVPVICLSQLNRGAEQREGHRPRMSDLRESGAIEQDADVVAMLHREEYYHRNDVDWMQENEDKVGVAELIFAKQRNGPTGVVSLSWDGQTTRFHDHTDASAPGGYYESKPYTAREPSPPRVAALSAARQPQPAPAYDAADDDAGEFVEEPPF